MIMRITRGKLHPGTWDAFKQEYEATVVTRSHHIDGLRGRWPAQDTHDADAGDASSVWESVEEMHAYEQSHLYLHEILPALQPFFVGDFSTTYCDVQVSQQWPAHREMAASGGWRSRVEEH